MTNVLHIDDGAVQQSLQKLIDDLSKRAALPGRKGAEARFQIALTPAFTRQLAWEVNNGTSGQDIGHGLSSAIAILVVNVVGSSIGGLDDKDAAVKVAGSLIAAIENTAAKVIAGALLAHGVSVEIQRGGRA